MRLRTLILASLIVLAAFGAAADCVFTPIYDGAYRFTALDVALDGRDLWAATSWGLALFDASVDPPRPVTTTALPGTTSAVAVVPGYIYVGSGANLFIMRKGDPLSIVGSASLPGTVNDLIVVNPYVFAATTAGVVQIDPVLPDRPAVIRTLSTTSGTALTLALSGSTLYASDGDSTVEVYNVQIPSFPQKLGTFDGLIRSLTVSEGTGRIFVSDGQQTAVYTGTGTQMTKLGTIAAGGSAVISAGNLVYLAGDDRRLRAFDVTNLAQPVNLYVSDAAPVGGTVNRIIEMVAGTGRIYVAAGDAGVLEFDTSGFTSPYPLRDHRFGGTGSVFSFGSTVAAAPSSGGLRLYSLGSGGELAQQVQWDGTTPSTIRDGDPTRLLTSTGTKIRLWDLGSNPPAEISSATLPAAISSAVYVGTTAIVVLTDHTVWTVAMTQASAVTTQATITGSTPQFVVRGGSDIAFADFDATGTTTIRYFAGANLAAAPAIGRIDGAATSGLGLSSNGLAAASTFRGLTLIDFSAGGSVTVIPGTNSTIARDLYISGTTLFVATTSTMQVWNTGTRTMTREVSIDSTLVAVHAASGSPSAVVATTDGIATVQYSSSSQSPQQLADAPANHYFRSAALGDRTLELFDGRDFDLVPLDTSGYPNNARALSPGYSIADFAAVGSTLYVLSSGGTVNGYLPDGAKGSTYQVAESGDQRVISMREVAGALWIAVEVNCVTGACELRTLVLDPRNGLTKTATLSGGVLAAAADGNRAWAAFDIPRELRVLNVADPYHPTTLVSKASTGNPVAIAHDPSRAAVYVVGQQLYVYSDATLGDLGALLEPYAREPSGRVGYVDQQIHVTGGCVLITGRTFSPQLFRVDGATNWTAVPIPGSAAAAVRSAVVEGSFIYLLSDYSLEIWSPGGTAIPRRRTIR